MSQSTTKRQRAILKEELSSITVGLHNIDDVIRKITKTKSSPEFLVIDLFCGAGGTSTGFMMAGKIAKVIACVNHDHLAIQSHWINHPEVAHFEEDIRILNLEPLKQLVAFYRRLYPNAKVILWASLECTNFSKAKGGQPRDADSRTLADHLHRYIKSLNPDYIQIENVVEFMSWGPLDDAGKPVSRRNGEYWMAWCNSIRKYGYNEQWTELNSADFGAFTSRNRLFGCFAKPGLPIIFPEASHSKKPSNIGTLFEKQLAPWKPVRQVLDLTDEGESIFNRKKPLVDNSLKRVYEGLIKFVAGGKNNFIIKYNSLNQQGRYVAPSVDDPCPTIAVQNRLGIAFISKYFSGKPQHKNISIDGPAGTIRTVDGQALVRAEFLVQRNSGKPESRVIDTNSPARTLTATGGNQDAVFLSSYYGSGPNNRSAGMPAATLTTKDRLSIISPEFISRDFTNGGGAQSIDQPAGSMLSVPKLNLVQCTPFVVRTSFGNQPTSIDDSCPTLLACRKHHYIINPSHGGHCSSVEAPSPVVIARQDKSPLYLMEAVEGSYRIPVYDTDTEIMVKIKEFMAMYGLVDIKMRMLKVAELLKIQGFPDGYVLNGNQSDQKKFIGNSVVPLVVQRWAEALAKEQPKKYISQPLKIAA